MHTRYNSYAKYSMRGSPVTCNQGLEMRASRDLTQKSQWKDGRVASVIKIHTLPSGRGQGKGSGQKIFHTDLRFIL